jgi:urease accessory protein
MCAAIATPIVFLQPFNRATMNRLISAVLLTLVSFSAWAHSGHDASSFSAGLTHPFGADHLLAMIIVGVWSALALPRQEAIIGPLAFIAALVGGALSAPTLANTINFSLINSYASLIEICVALSLIGVSALLVNQYLKTPINSKAAGVGLALVVFAGFCHGQAHGLEAPLQQLNQYIAGFVITSINLHLLGFTAALVLQKYLNTYLQKTVKAFGLFCALMGLGLAGIALF